MKDYYKIGEISKIYGIGRDSLMYYEEIGILKPFRGKNGYRMYSMNDIWKLNLIKELRTFDFSMEKIKSYLDERTIEKTKDMLNEEVVLIEEQMEELNRLKKNVMQRLNGIGEVISNIELYKIDTVYMSERRGITLNGNITRDEQVDFLVKKLQKKHEDKFYFLGNYNIGAVYPMNKIREGVFNEYKSVFCLLKDNEEDYDLILEKGKYITFSYRGAYKNSKNYIPTLLNFIDDNNYKALGDPIEMYMIDIHETGIVDEFITQIQIPIEIKDV